ncbi:MAG: PilZ domain-containing protein [Candidatus Omnitrophica bacterium]|nr:PilZ domain-containing protein [Candidatus Omnitrophota bacterium]
MDERRSAPRWAVNQEAELQIEDQPHTIPCTVEDISANGMRLSLGRRLFDEAFANISLALGQALNLNLGAHVAWQEQSEVKFTYGLFFNNIDDDQRNRIKEYIYNNFSEQERRGLNEQWWRGA